MPKGLPKTVRDNVHKSRASAIAAVSAYNRPDGEFRTYHFLVFITIAWTALFHATFYKRGSRPWYVRRATNGKGRRYVRIDGEPKHWELSECLRHYFKETNPPERKNLEFIIGLRNKIEHRHLPELDSTIYGECQASLMNFEDVLVKEFGQKYALTERLSLSLQFSKIIPEQRRAAAKKLVGGVAQAVSEYIEKFRGGLPSAILNDQGYSFSVFLVPKIAGRASAAEVAVEWVDAKNLSEDDLSRMEKLNVLIKEKHIPIANLDYLKPAEVVRHVQERIPFILNQAHHTRAWKHHGVRSSLSSPHPQKTKDQYCVFDKVHRDFLYTQAWVDLLVKDLSEEARFRVVTGMVPERK